MSASTITLWLLRETEKARLYSRTRLSNFGSSIDSIWIPKSIIEHTTKRGNEHDVTLPDWFMEKENL